jgi:hypothetical protein
VALGKWVNRADGVDRQTADDINAVANAVVEAEYELTGISLLIGALEPQVEQNTEKLNQIEQNQLPKVTASDAGKFLRVSPIGNWNVESLPVYDEEAM